MQSNILLTWYQRGISISHLTQPNVAFIIDDAPLPIKYTANFGAMIPLDELKRTYLYPSIIYISQQSYAQYNFGLDIEHGIITAGFWYRYSPTNGDAIIGLIGLKFWRFRFAYSYDVSTSGLSNYSGGANELSLAYLFRSKKGLTTARRVNSPSF